MAYEVPAGIRFWLGFRVYGYYPRKHSEMGTKWKVRDYVKKRFIVGFGECNRVP